jgi:N,N'-diacetyllegionaminate synthase
MKNKNKTLIIAEAGVNHNGSIVLAKKLIDVASRAGADIVKFQTFTANNLLTKYAAKANYQKKLTDPKETHFEMIKKLELTYKDHISLINHCIKRKIEFMSSPFDLESIEMLINLKVKRIKIPSSETNNALYLKNISKFNKEIIFSTGMSKINDIKFTYGYLVNNGVKNKNITILHCNSEYPTPYSDVNLKSMQIIKDKFKTKVGYSDHSLGIEVPIAAVALGADVIEKHITLDRGMQGPDHRLSLEPNELIQMIKSIRNIEEALGNRKKLITNSEIKNIKIHKKSIISKKEINIGDKFTLENITTKRPGTGISPKLYFKLIGKKSKFKYKKDIIINKSELQS